MAEKKTTAASKSDDTTKPKRRQTKAEKAAAAAELKAKLIDFTAKAEEVHRMIKASEGLSIAKSTKMNSKFSTIGDILFPVGIIDPNAPSSEVVLDRAIDDLAKGGSVKLAIAAMSRVSARLAAVRKLLS